MNDLITSTPFSNITNPTMLPLISGKVYKSLTIIFTVLYSIVFLSAYLQLWFILYLRHKLISAQTIYFFLCCLFTALRIVFFSFFFRNIPNANNLPDFWYWFLMCLPIVLQYFIVLLITVFYYKTYIKSKGQSSKLTRNSRVIIILATLLQFGFSFVPIWFHGCSDLTKKYSKCEIAVTSIYVILTDLLFLGTISTFVYVYKKFPNFPNATLIQEAKKITKSRSIIVSCACLFGVLAKLIYDLTALFGCSNNFNISLPSPLLQSDFVMLNRDVESYVVFGIVIFLWEIVPLLSLMILFRVQFPTGFFKKHRTTGNILRSYSRSRSTSLTSSSTSRSKFISIPNYGSSDSNTYTTGPFGRIRDRSNQQAGLIRAVSPLVNYSYGPGQGNGFQQQLRSPGASASYTILEDNKTIHNIKNKLITNILPRIVQKNSQRYHQNYNTKDWVVDPENQSSKPTPANEE